MTFVPTEGPPTANIMLVGEAPGKEEDMTGRPFVGRAGKTLNSLLSYAGINRAECLIANVARERPPANEIRYYFYDASCTKPKPQLVEWVNLLKEEIEQYRPNIVVALGRTALWALTGKTGIASYRGYIMESTLVRGQKVLATWHPQKVNYEWELATTFILDMRKALHHSKFPQIPKDRRVFQTHPTLQEFIDFCDSAEGPVALDLEATKTHVSWIGLSADPSFAISIQLLDGKYPKWPERDEIAIWSAVARLCEQCPIVMHNAVYDAALLWHRYHIFPRKMYMDTLLAAHVVWPELPRDLGYLASICLDVPVWKPYSSRDMGLYNAQDAAATIALVPILEREVRNAGQQHILDVEMKQLELAIYMQLQGIGIDLEKRDALLKECNKRLEELDEELVAACGRKINFNSPEQVKRLLYVDLGLPLQFKRRKSKEQERKVTTDEQALKRLAKVHPVPGLILERRAVAKKKSSFVDITVSPEGKVHTCYNIAGTSFGGRWSSSKSIILPYGSGNLQNIPEDARILYRAPKGKVFIGADYVQAEAVVVAYLCLDTVLMKLFKDSFGMSPSQRKEKYDVHRYTASIMYEIPVDEVTPAQRRIGKTLRHACNYAAGPATVAERLGVSLSQARALLDRYYEKNHLLKSWHMRIQQQLRQDRTLVNLFGRRHRFLGRWGDALFREAYAYIPQSSVGDLLNISAESFYRAHGDEFDVCIQLHDAIYVAAEPEKVDRCVCLMREHMIREIPVNNETMIIDVDFKVGEYWGDMKELDIDWRR